MIDLQDMLVKSLKAFDGQRDRSKQVQVGPSALGGCRRRVWHELKQTEKTNDPETLAAIIGTFIHAGIEKAIKREDPFGDNFLTEVTVEHGNMKGHVDLFIKDCGLVVDLKTKTKSNMRYFPSQAERWQVQTYGWLLSQNGYQVNEVALVAVPRDGGMAEIKVHSEPYDAPTAEAALAWLEEIRSLVEQDLPAPEPTERLAFCAKYCSYYDPSGVIGCPSTSK